jgi:hypothetical protein
LRRVGYAEPLRRLVVRGDRDEARAGNKRQHGPSDLSLLRPAWGDSFSRHWRGISRTR